MAVMSTVVGMTSWAAAGGATPLTAADPTTAARNESAPAGVPSLLEEETPLAGEMAVDEPGAIAAPLSTAQGGVAKEGGPGGVSVPPPQGEPGYPTVPAPAAPAKAKPKPPPQPWKPVFYDNDFSYKNKPGAPHFLGEELKDMPAHWLPFGDCDTTISYGGEVRYRFMDESNRLRPGGPARADYDLWRWRQYLDVKYSDEFRVYVEMIDAQMNRNTLPTTGIDVNRWDLQNAFFDVKVGERDDKPIYLRVGRQELLYGSQRLVSPLDWANTRRNFEGLKIFSKGDEWDLDLWATQTVNTATPGDGPVGRFDHSFDSPNQDHFFGGFWSTYKGIKNHTFDFYWLWDDNSRRLTPTTPSGERHTLATRWLGNFPLLDECDDVCRTWHGDIEGGYQIGDDFGRDVNAGFFTAGAGHTWNQALWEPNLWIFYDWASGDVNRGNGQTNTFHQQYGLVHAYLGLIDNIGRQNISDINGRFTVKPTKKLSLMSAIHFFDLASDDDRLYNVTGAPVGAPNTGTKVGQELDLVATYVFNPNFNIQAGYFWFWNDSFIRNNAPRGVGEMFYLQTTLSY